MELFVLMCVVLFVIGICLIRVGQWHDQEAEYWRHIQTRVLVNPKEDFVWSSLLKWTKEHPPSLLEKLSGWERPEIRQVLHAVRAQRS
jgi:hypothetical protein